MQSSLKYKIPFHLAGWALFFIVPLLLFPAHQFASSLKDPQHLISMISRNILWMGLFYLNLLYLTPVMLKDKGVVFFLCLTTLVILIITIANSTLQPLFSGLLNGGNAARPFPGGGPPPDGFGPGPGFNPDFPRRPPPFGFGFGHPGPFFSNLLISLIVASVSTSMVLWNDWVKARAEEQERAFQKVASELAVLKLQISPHFLFNTLNNIRWLIRSGSADAENAVIKLSHLLRYVLYQSELEKVSLEKEIEHLRDYIQLQKMRLVSTDSVFFETKGAFENYTIVPLLLIPLVENVFKYGELNNPSENQITIKVVDGVLAFKTVNRITQPSEEPVKKDYGIGLDNVQRRLALHYPDRHVLRYKAEDNLFELTLDIILT